MLSNDRKRIRHEDRLAEMRARLSVRPLSPARQERLNQRKAADRKLRQHEQDREEWRFTLMGRYLGSEVQALADERYVTAMWGVKTSWKRIERMSIYYVWRSRAETRTRKYNSTRPRWYSEVRLDKHHLSSPKVVPIRPPLRPFTEPSRQAA